MARHRAAVLSSRRGVAIWPFVAVAAVLALLLGWLGWNWAGGVLERRLQAVSASCQEGEAVLTVAVTPTMADVVGRAADAWSRSRPVIMDHCIRVEVAALAPQAVLDGLTTGWDAKALGARPGAWLPESSLWINRLSAQDAKLIGSQPTSIATSPVVLAMPDAAAKAFFEGSGLQWRDLPGLVSEPQGWARFGHPEWGRFTVAMPDVARNPASALALQSVLAGSSPKGTGPVTVDMLTVPAVTDAMARLATSSPPVAGTTVQTLDELARSGDIAAAVYDAVPALEYDLYRRNTGIDGNPAAAQTLVGMPVGGPTPTADFPFVAIAGDRIDQLQVRAAQQLREFLQSADQQTELSRAGLRVPGSKERPDSAPGIRWSVTQDELTSADANTTQQISAAWTNAGGSGQVVTVLVDVSKSMLEDGGGGRTKLDWVKESLTGQVSRFGSGAMGLWVFSSALGEGGEPFRRLVATAPVSQQRDELFDAVGGIEAAAATHLYPSLLTVYREALDGYQQGRVNRVVLITDGRNDSQTMNYEQFRRELDELVGRGVELPISVVAVGPDVDREVLTELSRSTGGTFNAAQDGTRIEAALGQLLSAG